MHPISSVSWSPISAYVIELFMLVVLACRGHQAYLREWLNVAVLFGVEAVCVVFQFSATFLVELAGEWTLYPLQVRLFPNLLDSLIA